MDTEASYESVEYWEKRYSSCNETYDWYNEWPEIKKFLPFQLDKMDSVLHIGCGNSSLGFELVKEGIAEVKNIDYSVNCITSMKKMYPDLDYEVINALDLSSQLAEMHYDVVIDKGCLDTILCSEKFDTEVPKMLNNINQIMRSDGVLVIISVGCPANRLMFLEAVETWTISVIKMPKRHAELLDDAEMLLNQSSCIFGTNVYKKHQSLAHEESNAGSSEISEDLDEEVDERQHHFIYICRKSE